jgi:hypothetical protein
MPFRNGNIVPNATLWTPEMLMFLKENYQVKTNPELAKGLGLRLTVTRNKLRELGLKRIEMEYWNDEMISFLKNSYKTIGDVEIAELFEKHWPKNKKWTKNHISKKRRYLKLDRTAEEIFAIASKNSSPGGKSFTILKNSSSLNMHDSWVVQQIAWRNRDLQSELIKHPDIIESSKALLRLKRVVRQTKNNQQQK